ncbi:MAG: hypothetical protein IJF82_20800 [Achromobacter sp.]|nr:hypothetical protein [Achromobacter sp.]MBQ3612711.1 hypothetical protein [Bacteroidales bacterium]
MNNIRKVMWQWGDAREQASRYQSQIRDFEKRLDDIRGLSSPSLDGMPHGTGISNPTARKAEKIIQLCDLYEETIIQTYYLLNRTLDIMVKVDGLLEECSPLQRNIAYLRYRERRPWVYISMKLSVSEAWARKQDEQMCRYITEAIK